jgi:DNA-binding NarL/FixJ family response regulator
MVRALVVDDHPVIREGVINALAEADIEVVAQAGSRA